MSKTNFEISEKFQNYAKINNVDIYSILYKRSFLNKVFYYMIDSKFRRSVHLQRWVNSQRGNEEVCQIANTLKSTTGNHDVTMKKIVKYWTDKRQYKDGHLTYVGDQSNYGKNEYWATADEILEKGKDDCDGFMLMIYLTAAEAGIPDNRLFCTCGNVVGGGHAYVTYIANNGVMYPIDGCYYPKNTWYLDRPYFDCDFYYNGEKEWFRFNSSGSYKLHG